MRVAIADKLIDGAVKVLTVAIEKLSKRRKYTPEQHKAIQDRLNREALAKLREEDAKHPGETYTEWAKRHGLIK